MRGEYKVPGGKLVAVDVEVADGRLSEVAVSGDFFLEPDSALDDINAALRGMPADSDAEQLAHAISTALDESVSMIASRRSRSVSRSGERSATPRAGRITPSTSSRRWFSIPRCTSRWTRSSRVRSHRVSVRRHCVSGTGTRPWS